MNLFDERKKCLWEEPFHEWLVLEKASLPNKKARGFFCLRSILTAGSRMDSIGKCIIHSYV